MEQCFEYGGVREPLRCSVQSVSVSWTVPCVRFRITQHGQGQATIIAQDFGVSEGGPRMGGQVGRCESHQNTKHNRNHSNPDQNDVTGQGGYKPFV